MLRCRWWWVRLAPIGDAAPVLHVELFAVTGMRFHKSGQADAVSRARGVYPFEDQAECFAVVAFRADDKIFTGSLEKGFLNGRRYVFHCYTVITCTA